MTSQRQQLLENQAKELAGIILGSSPTVQSFYTPSFPQGSQQVQLLQGVITNMPFPGYVDVSIGGSDISVPFLRHLDAYTPRVGDVVWLIRKGVDSIVLGALRNVVEQAVSTTLEPPSIVGAAGSGTTYANGWSALGTNGVQAQFWEDPDHVTHLSGVMVAGTNGVSAWQLPAFYRPVQNCFFTTVCANNNNGVKLVVGSDGTVVATGVAASDEVVLSGICFPNVFFDFSQLRPIALANGFQPDTTISQAYPPSAWERDDGWVLMCGAMSTAGAPANVGGVISLAYTPGDYAPREGRGQQLSFYQNSVGAHAPAFGRTVWRGSTLSLPGSLVANEVISIEGLNFVNNTMEEQWDNWFFANGWTNISIPLYGRARIWKDKYSVAHAWGTIKPSGSTTLHFYEVPGEYQRNPAPGPTLPKQYFRAYGNGTFLGAHKITYTGTHNLDPAGVTHIATDELSIDGAYWRTDEESDVGYV